MNHLDFTTLIAIDAEHAEELRLAWPTWLHYRPEIYLQPMVLMLDEACHGIAESLLNFLGKLNCRIEFVPVEVPTCRNLSQRQRMLRALIHGAKHVDTEWTLKLDTDTLPYNHCIDWANTSQVSGGEVFISNPWGYTKPANAIQLLDDWADKVPELAAHKRLNIPPHGPNPMKVMTPGRVISYAFFGQTAWLQHAADLATDDMPIWSHDTYLWYLARRTGAAYAVWNRQRRKELGWTHCSRNLRDAASKLNVRPEFDRQPYRKQIATTLQNHFGLSTEESSCSPKPDPKICGAEVGVSRGETSAFLFSALGWALTLLHLVDAWDTAPASEAYRASGDGHAKLKPSEHYDNLLATVSNTAFAHDRIRLHRKTSELAAAEIADASLDFVFLDGDHSYEGVKQDLALWSTKVRYGGLLMGHDFGHPRCKRLGADGQPLFGVDRAVTEFAATVGGKVHVGEGTVWWMAK